MRAFVTLLSVFLLLSFSCKRGSGEGDVNNQNSDTLEKAVPLEQLFLPDTAYASAQKVVYVVEKTDTLAHFLKDVEDRYASDFSTFTFRRNMLRDASFAGKLDHRPDTVEIAWTFNTPEDGFNTRMGNWGGGTGWTGQPIYVHWKAEAFFSATVLAERR